MNKMMICIFPGFASVAAAAFLALWSLDIVLFSLALCFADVVALAAVLAGLSVPAADPARLPGAAVFHYFPAHSVQEVKKVTEDGVGRSQTGSVIAPRR